MREFGVNEYTCHICIHVCRAVFRMFFIVIVVFLKKIMEDFAASRPEKKNYLSLGLFMDQPA